MTTNPIFNPSPAWPRYRSPRGGYTLLELIVAMTVLAIALSGLFPLTAILYRHLQPIKRTSGGYDCRTPARDGNTTGNVIYSQHTWYLTPYTSAWARKLGASAQLTPNAFIASTSPRPLAPAVERQDDYSGTPTADDGTGTYADSGDWAYDGSASQASGGDQHRHIALPAGSTSSSSATWTLTAVAAGWYSIQATWTASNDQVTDAVYTVLKNGSPLPTVPPVNQQVAPAGGWAPLTPALVHLNANDIVQVQLGTVRAASTEAGKYMVADAVRIVYNQVKIRSLERSLLGTNSNSINADVTARVSVTVNLAQ